MNEELKEGVDPVIETPIVETPIEPIENIDTPAEEIEEVTPEEEKILEEVNEKLSGEMMTKETILTEYSKFEDYSNEFLSNEAIEKVIIDIELKLANNYNLIMDAKNNIEACFVTLDKYPQAQVSEALNIARRIANGEIGKKQLPKIQELYGEIVANALVVIQKIEEANNKYIFNKFYEDRLKTFYKLRK